MVNVIALTDETKVDAELPDFSTMTEEEIRAYAGAEGDKAFKSREEFLREVEFQFGSWSPENARRQVRAQILKTAGLLTEDEFEEATQPVHVGRGLQMMS